MKMAPGSSGGDKPGAGGCIRRTDQLHTSMCKRQAKPASKYVLRYQGEGLMAGTPLCNSFPLQGTELAPGAPRWERGEPRSSPQQHRLGRRCRIRSRVMEACRGLFCRRSPSIFLKFLKAARQSTCIKESMTQGLCSQQRGGWSATPWSTLSVIVCLALSRCLDMFAGQKSSYRKKD